MAITEAGQPVPQVGDLVRRFSTASSRPRSRWWILGEVLSVRSSTYCPGRFIFWVRVLEVGPLVMWESAWRPGRNYPMTTAQPYEIVGPIVVVCEEGEGM